MGDDDAVQAREAWGQLLECDVERGCRALLENVQREAEGQCTGWLKKGMHSVRGGRKRSAKVVSDEKRERPVQFLPSTCATVSAA